MKKRMISLLVLLFVILLISVAFSLHVLAEAVVSNVVFTSEASPAEMNKCMQIYWYKAGKGKIYIDNVKLSNQHT